MNKDKTPEEAAEEYADKESIHSYEHNDWPEIYRAYLAGDSNGYSRCFNKFPEFVEKLCAQVRAEEQKRIWEEAQTRFFENEITWGDLKQIIFGGGDE